MADQQTRQDRGLPEEIRSAVRAMWALGDYNRFATASSSSSPPEQIPGRSRGQRSSATSTC
jgi:hypothetical protein